MNSSFAFFDAADLNAVGAPRARGPSLGTRNGIVQIHLEGEVRYRQYRKIYLVFANPAPPTKNCTCVACAGSEGRNCGNGFEQTHQCKTLRPHLC